MSTNAMKISWMPYSVAEAAIDGGPTPDGDLAAAWERLLSRLKDASEVALGARAIRNEQDHAAGLRHLLVLLGLGIDEILRFEPAREPHVGKTNVDDALSWGMECPDCIYHRANLQGGKTYRIVGNRGTARYVGLQTMNGLVSTRNVLADELELDADGNFELVLSPEEHPGNWMPTTGDHPVLVIRHFFYDWAERPSTLEIVEVTGEAGDAPVHLPLEVSIPRQVGALGDFVVENLEFFLDWYDNCPVNGFQPPVEHSNIGAAAENRPVIGRWELEPDQALILEVEPPKGVYWSYSLGNLWWETIHYGRHQSSLNGSQADVDSDGKVRVVLARNDPGIANWLDTGGFGGGAIILRCVRTETAPIPEATLVPLSDVLTSLPPETRRVDPEERRQVLAARRRAVTERFGR